MKTSAILMMSAVLVACPALASAVQIVGEGQGVDTDLTSACNKAVEAARDDVASKAEGYVHRVESVEINSKGDTTESAFSQSWKKLVLASTQLVKVLEKTPELSEDQKYITCRARAAFEVDTDAARSAAEAHAATEKKETATALLIAQYESELAFNQKSYRDKQAALSSQLLAPRRGSVQVACPAGDLMLCQSEVRAELALRERRRLAAAISVEERWLEVSVVPQDGRQSQKAINNSQQNMTWEGTYAVAASLSDPFVTRNAELNEKVRNAKMAYVPAPEKIRTVTRFEEAASRVSLVTLLVWECADCDENEFEPLQPTDANIGGRGLVFRAIYDDWIGISSGWFREGIVYCSRTDIAYPGAPETCSDGSSTSGDMIGLGPYLAWGALSFEAMRMTHASDIQVFGLNITEPYWRYNVSLNFGSESAGLMAGLGYSRRVMPDLPGDLVTWNETSDLSLNIGYRF